MSATGAPMNLLDQMTVARDVAERNRRVTMRQLAAAERKHDTARTEWGRERAKKRVLALFAEVRMADRAIGDAKFDLALLAWKVATETAADLETKARDLVDAGAGADAINAAFRERDEAYERIPVAAAEVERWKPVKP